MVCQSRMTAHTKSIFVGKGFDGQMWAPDKRWTLSGARDIPDATAAEAHSAQSGWSVIRAAATNLPQGPSARWLKNCVCLPVTSPER